MPRVVRYETTPSPVSTRNRSSGANGGQLGFEETLWLAADKSRGHVDPSEYKHIVLGLIFLK